MTKPYELIVFDWDGTLVDSIGRIITCFQMSFGRLGLPEPEGPAIAQLIGLPLADSFKLLNPQITAEQDDELVETYRDIWLGDTLPLSELFPGVIPMLENLVEQGYQMAVATGKSRAGLDRELNHHNLGRLFPHSRCAGEGLAKPNPGILLELIDLYGAKPEQTIMIGDTTMDLEMANNAGAKPVAVTTGGHSEEQLLGTNPIACLKSVTDLPMVLDAGVKN